MSLQVSSMAPPIPVHVDPSISPTILNSHKRPRLQQKEEVFQPLFDVEMLSKAISEQFKEDGKTAQEVAEAFSTMDPEILMQFSIYRPSEVNKIFRESFKTTQYSVNDQAAICATVHQLCITSLINSKYQQTMTTLESSIMSYLQLIHAPRIQRLIQSTERLLSSKSPSLCSLNNLGEKIDQTLDLFYYTSPDSQECINLLAHNTFIQEGVLRYPTCKEYFQTLCQQLSILSSEQVKLRTLPTQIRAKLSDLQTKSKLVYEALEKKEAMLPTVVMSLDRMKFCNAESALLWKTGSDLLMAVFIATLEHKKTNKKWKFPSDLSNAINQTAEMDSAWTHLPLNRLLTSPFPYFTIGFVANVWGTYTQNLTNIEDVGALMRYCIHALPQTGFQKITKAKDKSKALEQEFYRLIREDVTFVTLKEWAQKQKRLVEETA